MPKISLQLIVQGKEICSGRGLSDEQGRIIYTWKTGEIPTSHGLLNINDTYMQLLELINEKHRNKHYEIKINIEKD